MPRHPHHRRARLWVCALAGLALGLAGWRVVWATLEFSAPYRAWPAFVRAVESGDAARLQRLSWPGQLADSKDAARFAAFAHDLLADHMKGTRYRVGVEQGQEDKDTWWSTLWSGRTTTRIGVRYERASAPAGEVYHHFPVARGPEGWHMDVVQAVMNLNEHRSSNAMRNAEEALALLEKHDIRVLRRAGGIYLTRDGLAAYARGETTKRHMWQFEKISGPPPT